MRHLPNLLTLANLFCGCIAIVLILNAQPFLFYTGQGEPGIQWSWVYGVAQLQWGAILIFIAGVFDVLDGLAARALKVYSPIGKDLDSLADVVSFGVAPAMILYKLLWDSVTREPMVRDVNMALTAPAFLLACFAALRLARFNNEPPKKNNDNSFTGLPTPAAGIFVACFGLMNWDNPGGMSSWLFSRWPLYGLIILLCWLMVSRVRFMKLMPPSWNIQQIWPRLLLIVAAVAGIALFRFDAAPIIFALYLLLSFFIPKNDPAAESIVNRESSIVNSE